MLKNVLIATAGSYPTAASPYLLASGEVGVYSQALDGTYTLITSAISAAQAKLPVVIAQGVPAGKQIKLFTIQPGQKTAYSYNPYAAPVPNVFVVGYDGVTATYDLVSGAAGTYDFKLQNITPGNPPFPTIGSTPYFNTAAAATSNAIAESIVKDVNNQQLTTSVDVMPSYRFAFAEILSNTARNSGSGQTGTCTVVNGSATVTAVTLTSAVLAPAAGSYVAIGSTTSTLAAVYKIESVSGTTGAYTLTLSSPYVNGNVALGTSLTSVAIVTVATPSASSKTGIRVTEFGNTFNGISVQEPYPNKILNVSCNVNLSGTPVQNNQLVAKEYTGSNGAITSGAGTYTEGNGTYAQVFKAELTAAGYIGFINRTFLPDNFPLYSVSGTTYNMMGLSFYAPAKDYTAQNFKFGELQDALIALDDVSGTQYSTLNTVLASTNW
jgi:hypothetical protein